jgi:lipase maturation factor
VDSPGAPHLSTPLAAQLAGGRGSYWLTRFLFLRLLGLIYLVAFLVSAQQARPLIGAHGLLPACDYLERVRRSTDSNGDAFVALPTVFWFACSDATLAAGAQLGIVLAAAVTLGVANVPLLAALWFLYLSFVHVGQLFYGYGWEILLLETGFLAIFLCPVLDPRPFPARVPPPTPIVWLLRWVLFRVMLGAGLIKLRGDPCWRDLTCMLYHYETQPLPNPLSWYFHHLPPLFHRFEVLFNHFVELVVPWSLFAPRRIRQVGGCFLVAFQILLILSGNLSWLNWLTLALCVSCFDDQALGALVPRRLRQWVAVLGSEQPSRGRLGVVYALVVLVAFLSLGPVQNLIGRRQMMNASFDPLHLVNTYGAFGSVGKQRPEIILEGTSDATITDATQWRAYEFKCKPGDPMRHPCVVAPYHYRLDWQMWFAAMQDARSNPWLLHLIAKLLENDPGALSLVANNPFPDRPPRYIRAQLYDYRFTDSGVGASAWWQRHYVRPYIEPLSLTDPALQRILHAHGWES